MDDNLEAVVLKLCYYATEDKQPACSRTASNVSNVGEHTVSQNLVPFLDLPLADFEPDDHVQKFRR
jgi:hypothetical protein